MNTFQINAAWRGGVERGLGGPRRLSGFPFYVYTPAPAMPVLSPSWRFIGPTLGEQFLVVIVSDRVPA